MTDNKIKFAYYLAGWTYDRGNTNVLKSRGIQVTPTDYEAEMEGNIFCPGCFTNLIRSPKNEPYFSDGRNAYFAHKNEFVHIRCDLRSIRAEGKRYDTYEEARRAVEDESLVIVHGFMQNKPVLPGAAVNPYDATPVEDMRGPNAGVPIGRHIGENFNLPSRITSVAGICRNFSKNLYKHYYFPNAQLAFRLIDMLHDASKVYEIDPVPKLYFGKIIGSWHAGAKAPYNIRFTYFHSSPAIADMCIKMTHGAQLEHGIDDSSTGRYVLVYGTVERNGAGLCFANLAWGEFALLPAKYNELLEDF
jgi:hypothetical protein